MDKQTIRQEILSQRDNQAPDEIEAKSRKIAQRLFGLPEFKKAGVVMFYLSFKSEVKTEKMIEKALRLKKRVVIPVVKKGKKGMLIAELKDQKKDLTVGDYGILCPKKTCLRPVDQEIIDLVIVPGAVFDERCHRLGYGKGFYDRFLSRRENKVTAVGLCFNLQVVSKVPEAKHDKQLDKVITESRIITSYKKGRA